MCPEYKHLDKVTLSTFPFDTCEKMSNNLIASVVFLDETYGSLCLLLMM